MFKWKLIAIAELLTELEVKDNAEDEPETGTGQWSLLFDNSDNCNRTGMICH